MLVSTPYMDEAERCSYLAFLSDRADHPRGITGRYQGGGARDAVRASDTAAPGRTGRGNRYPELFARRICTAIWSECCGPVAAGVPRN